jgi:predicted RNase H-like nuclease (RuvC/YqgF family)
MMVKRIVLALLFCWVLPQLQGLPAAAFVDPACERLAAAGELPLADRLTAVESCLAAQEAFLARVARDTKANVESIGELYANLNSAVTASKTKNPDTYYRDNINALKRELAQKERELKQLREETEQVKSMFSFMFLSLDPEALKTFVDLYRNRNNRDHRLSEEMQKRVTFLKSMAEDRP